MDFEKIKFSSLKNSKLIMAALLIAINPTTTISYDARQRLTEELQNRIKSDIEDA